MKKLLLLSILFVAISCSTTKHFNPVYLQTDNISYVLDSISKADNVIIPATDTWERAMYLGVSEGDTTFINVSTLWFMKNKIRYIFSITEANKVSLLNFRKE